MYKRQQIQCGLLVSGRAWCDYVSYCAGMPLYVKRVYPDGEWMQAVVDATEYAEERIEQALAEYAHVIADMPVMPESTFDQELTF